MLVYALVIFATAALGDLALASFAFGFDGARCDRIVANVLTRGRATGLCMGGGADAT